MPALTKVTLDKIQLTGELGANPVLLSESLKKFKMPGGFVGEISSVNLNPLVCLLCSMPALTKVTLDSNSTNWKIRFQSCDVE